MEKQTIFRKVNISDVIKDRYTEDEKGCYIWNMSKNKDGYGYIRFNNKCNLAHRVVMSISKGYELSKHQHVLHKCDNPSCVNIEHLFIGNHTDNMKDKVKKGRSRNKNRSSYFIGVSFRSDNKSWRSYFIDDNKKYITIGHFKTEEMAYKARCEYILNKITNVTNK